MCFHFVAISCTKLHVCTYIRIMYIYCNIATFHNRCFKHLAIQKATCVHMHIHIHTYTHTCVCTTLRGWIKGKSRNGCTLEKRDANNLYPAKWCHSLYRHNKITIDCGFEFVNNIKSINLNTKCFLMGVGFLSHGDPGASLLTDSVNGSHSPIPNSWA